MQKKLYLGIFFLSFSVLAFELSLIRLLSVIFIPNVAFLSISFALFGVALGGIIVYFFPKHFTEADFEKNLAKYSFFFTVSLVIYASLILIPERSSTIIVLAILPFLFANICLTLLFKYKKQDVNKLYFFDLFGAGAGVIGVIFLMGFFSAINILLTAALAGFIASNFFSSGKKQKILNLFLFFSIIIAIIINSRTNFLETGAIFAKIGGKDNLILSRWNSFSHITVEKDNNGPYADQAILHLKIDGDALTNIYNTKDPLVFDQLNKDMNGAVFKIAYPGQALVIGSGGGRDVLMASRAGFNVMGVDINPIINDLMKNKFREYNGDLYYKEGINVITAEGRSFVHQDKGSYDAISIPLVDTWASTAGGTFALVENYLYTVEAFQDYLVRLKDDGILSLGRWEMEGIRLLPIYLDAAKKIGIQNPEKNIVILQSDIDEHSLTGKLNNYLFKKTAFTDKELNAIYKIAKETNSSVIYDPKNKYNSDEYRYLSSNDKKAFVKSYYKNISPVYDDKPFFFFIKPIGKFNEINIVDGGLGRIFGLIAFLTAFCLILPFFSKNQSLKFFKSERRNFFSFLGYFCALGLAFIIIEMSLVQKFILYLERPIYSYSVVLASLLVFASLGSFLSRKIEAKIRNFYKIGSAIFAAIIIYYIFLDKIINNTIGAGIVYKIIAATAISFLPAVLMGMLFPLGIRRLNEFNLNNLIPWCWAVNGAFSVFATVLATFGAIFFGFNFIMLIGGLMYLLAIFSINFSRNKT